MEWKRLAIAGLVGGLALGAAGCTDGYGYSGVSMGYGSGYADGYGYGGDYYDDGYYGDPYYSGGGYGGYGYAPSYYGWYDNFYYPGVGIYIYDRNHRRYRWNDRQRRYWEQRRGRQQGRENWGGFQHRPQSYYRGGQTYRGNRTGQDYRPRTEGTPQRYQAPTQTYQYRGRSNGGWQGRPSGSAPRGRAPRFTSPRVREQ